MTPENDNLEEKINYEYPEHDGCGCVAIIVVMAVVVVLLIFLAIKK